MQVSTVELGFVEILTTGRLAFWVIVMLAVAVQPFAAVTVTVNIPGERMLTEAFVPRPFDHK
mgnify:CR=1 FL=1